MDPPLVVHSDVGPVLNDWWEKTPFMSEELQKIKSFLDRIKTLKQQGLTGFGIMASYLRRRVQPLKVRETVNGEPYGPPIDRTIGKWALVTRPIAQPPRRTRSKATCKTKNSNSDYTRKGARSIA